MPMDRKFYPDNWDEIALMVKTEANWCCEGCGKPCRRPGVTWFNFVFGLAETQNRWYCETYIERFDPPSEEWRVKEKPGRFVLTVAHLDHRPENCDRSNLKALCAPCHCRYDLKDMERKRYLKRERFGQLSLLKDN